MKSEDRDELLEQLYVSDEKSPELPVETVLALAKREVARRQRIRRCAAVGAGLVVVGAGLAWFARDGADHLGIDPLTPNSFSPSIASRPSVLPAPAIPRINEEQMFAMLDQAPSALVEYPDGRKSVLVVVPTAKR